MKAHCGMQCVYCIIKKLQQKKHRELRCFKVSYPKN